MLKHFCALLQGLPSRAAVPVRLEKVGVQHHVFPFGWLLPSYASRVTRAYRPLDRGLRTP
eukprot:3786365-Prymnesium_polylepis.3